MKRKTKDKITALGIVFILTTGGFFGDNGLVMAQTVSQNTFDENTVSLNTVSENSDTDVMIQTQELEMETAAEEITDPLEMQTDYESDSTQTQTEVPVLEQVQNVTAASQSYCSITVNWRNVKWAEGYEIYYSDAIEGSYQLAGDAKGSLAMSFTHDKLADGSELVLGTTYYYKVFAYRQEGETRIRSEASALASAQPELSQAVITAVTSNDFKSLAVTYEQVSGANGYVIYRSTEPEGRFKKVKEVKKAATLLFTDKTCKTGVTYYYKLRAYRKVNGKNWYGAYSEVASGQPTLARPKLKKPVVRSADAVLLSWNKVSGASGYVIYRSETKKGTYKKVKTVKGSTRRSYIVSGHESGKTYFYKIRAYCSVSGKKRYSEDSNLKSAVFNFYGYEGESYQDRAQRIFGLGYYQKYSSKEEADANMTSFTIPVWDFAADGVTKVTKYRTLTVHKNIAETVKCIFQEIYEGEERFPIKNVGGYSWRGDSSTSEHCCGLAIDINWEENYMIDSGVILSGKYWKPGEDPYSIPADSEVVKIMAKYGFSRGIWGDRCDYMHFSYFGT